MKHLALILLVLACNVCYANEADHLRLAREFDSLSSAQNKSSLMAAFIPSFLSTSPISEAQKKGFERWAAELLESEEYRLGVAKIYMQLFSPEELKELIKIVRKPAYRLLQNKRNEVTRLLSEHAASVIENRSNSLRELLSK